MSDSRWIFTLFYRFSPLFWRIKLFIYVFPINYRNLDLISRKYHWNFDEFRKSVLRKIGNDVVEKRTNSGERLEDGERVREDARPEDQSQRAEAHLPRRAGHLTYGILVFFCYFWKKILKKNQDPRVVDAMLPYMIDDYGNPHSRTHAYGWKAEEAVERAREQVATLIKVKINSTSSKFSDLL